MEVLILTIFASAALVAAALLFFAWNVRSGSHEHADRLALLPLQQERRQRHAATHGSQSPSATPPDREEAAS